MKLYIILYYNTMSNKCCNVTSSYLNNNVSFRVFTCFYIVVYHRSRTTSPSCLFRSTFTINEPLKRSLNALEFSRDQFPSSVGRCRSSMERERARRYWYSRLDASHSPVRNPFAFKLTLRKGEVTSLWRHRFSIHHGAWTDRDTKVSRLRRISNSFFPS